MPEAKKTQHSSHESSDSRKLSVLNKIVWVLNEPGTLDGILQKACEIIPEVYLEPEKVSVLITYQEKSYRKYPIFMERCDILPLLDA